jgi:hypothetical protein
MTRAQPGAPWSPTSADLVSIEKASVARRGDCVAFIEEFGEMYSVDRSADELDRTWIRLVEQFPWYAEDLLHCLEVTLEQPDCRLPAVIVDAAQLEAEDGDVGLQSSMRERQALARGWLEKLRDRFRPMFDQLSTP